MSCLHEQMTDSERTKGAPVYEQRQLHSSGEREARLCEWRGVNCNMRAANARLPFLHGWFMLEADRYREVHFLELRTLRYFLAAAQERNMTRAADILHVTQPTLSRQIMDLERELGVTLMARGKNGLTLTDDGLFFRQRAQEIVELADRLEKNFAQRQNDISGMVVIGASEAVGSQTLARLIRKFSEKYPAVQFTLYNETVDNVRDRLDKGLVDIGLLLEPIDVARYDYVRLVQQDTWGLLVRDDHPLTAKESVTAEDVVPFPLILPLRESIRAEILHWTGREEKELRIPLFYTLLSNAALMVAEGLGCAFCMDGALAIRSDPHLRFIPLAPRRMTHSALVWKRNTLFSPAASLFIQEINLLRAQIDEPFRRTGTAEG